MPVSEIQDFHDHVHDKLQSLALTFWGLKLKTKTDMQLQPEAAATLLWWNTAMWVNVLDTGVKNELWKSDLLGKISLISLNPV